MGDIGKTHRVLEMYQKLQEGKALNKNNEATYYGVSTKSIQRDIEEIRVFIGERMDTYGLGATVKFDKAENVYRLESENYRGFSSAELFAVSKILLDSRALTQGEISDLLTRLGGLSSTEEEKMLLEEMIANELYHYTELQHKTNFKELLWSIAQAIKAQKCIEIQYKKEDDKELRRRKLQPMGVFFSEFYFYLVAFIVKDENNIETKGMDELYPIIYRVDRIKELEILNLSFRINQMNRFQEGEFKKRIQFMQGGKLEHITFEFIGESIEAVIDRLPTAKIRKIGECRYEVRAEIYGRGIDMWIRGQGDRIEKIQKRS